jgi:hypothetical protein
MHAHSNSVATTGVGKGEGGRCQLARYALSHPPKSAEIPKLPEREIVVSTTETWGK